MGSVGVMAELDTAWELKPKAPRPENYFTSAEYAKHLGIDPRNAWARLKKLETQGVVRQVTAAGNWRGWEFLGRGEQSGVSGGQGDIQAAGRIGAGAAAVVDGDSANTSRSRRTGGARRRRVAAKRRGKGGVG